MKQKTQNIFDKLQYWWRHYWLVRWVIANIIGWASGLVIATTGIRLFALPGAILSGALFGLGLSLPQAWILFSGDERDNRQKWILYSAIGGFFGVFPVGFLSIIGIFNLWIAALLMGMVFGGIWGLLQSLVLLPLLGERAYLWIPMCMLAGAVSALFSVPILATAIPLLFSPATIVFSLMTGWLMLRWMDEH